MRLALALALSGGCGARTGLLFPDAEAPAGHDAGPYDAGRPDAGSCCLDGQNTDFSPDSNCFHGVPWLAWDYTPACDIDAAQIEIHSDGSATVGDGALALLGDTPDGPGPVLFQGSLPSADPPDWIGAEIDPPLHMEAGRTYWIAERALVCSKASGGVPHSFVGAYDLAGPWSEPTGETTTSIVHGACARDPE